MMNGESDDPQDEICKLIDVHYSALIQCMLPASGLLNELISYQIVTRADVDRILRLPTWDLMNDEILRCVKGSPVRALHSYFTSALCESGQNHVVSLLGGICEGSENSPLTSSELQSLDHNLTFLVNNIQPDSGLLSELVSRQVIRRRDEARIRSKSTACLMNEELIKLLRRGSRKSLKDFGVALKCTNQLYKFQGMLENDRPAAALSKLKDDTLVEPHKPLSVEDLNAIATCLEHSRKTVIRCIHPANGLLNELICLEVIDYSEKDRLEALSDWEDISEQLIRLVEDDSVKCSLFLDALCKCGQEHVVNFLWHIYDTDVLPLSEAQLFTIDVNTSYIVDTLELESGLLNILLAKAVVIERDYSLIISKPTSWDMNEEFVRLLRCRSQKSLHDFIRTLTDENQVEIGRLLRRQGIVCRIHIQLLKMPNNNETECIVSTNLNQVLREIHRNTVHCEDHEMIANILHQMTCSTDELCILRTTLGGSIVLHWFCGNQSALERLRELDRSGQLQRLLESMIKLIVCRRKFALLIKPWNPEYERCKTGFRLLEAMQSVKHPESNDFRTAVAYPSFEQETETICEMDRLPLEMIDNILEKSVMLLERSIKETSSNPLPAVYRTVAAVCGGWKSRMNRRFNKAITNKLFYLWGPHFRSPTLVHVLEKPGYWIRGVATLNDSLYVAIEFQSQVAVYSLKDFAQQHSIKIDKLEDPWDMAACSRQQSLYLPDWKKNCVWKVTPDDGYSYEWITLNADESPRGVSVCVDGSVVLLCRKHFQPYYLAVYDHDSKLRYRINLPETDEPNRAALLPNGNFALCHGRLYETAHRVCEVTRDGVVKYAFGGMRNSVKRTVTGPDGLTLDELGRVFCADWGNDRVIQMSPDMKYVRPIISKNDGLWGRPRRLTYDALRNLLIVGQDSGHVSIYRLHACKK